MSEKAKPLTVKVTGGDRMTNTLVFGLIQDTLSSIGFENVEASSVHGDATGVRNNMPTMMDLIASHSPDLLAQPVIVRQDLKGAADLVHPLQSAIDYAVYGDVAIPISTDDEVRVYQL